MGMSKIGLCIAEMLPYRDSHHHSREIILLQNLQINS